MPRLGKVSSGMISALKIHFGGWDYLIAVTQCHLRDFHNKVSAQEDTRGNQRGFFLEDDLYSVLSFFSLVHCLVAFPIADTFILNHAYPSYV